MTRVRGRSDRRKLQLAFESTNFARCILLHLIYLCLPLYFVQRYVSGKLCLTYRPFVMNVPDSADYHRDGNGCVNIVFNRIKEFQDAH